MTTDSPVAMGATQQQGADGSTQGAVTAVEMKRRQSNNKSIVDIPVGESVPADTPHAISVSLPTWRDVVGYEEGDPRVVNAMKCGYPRFFFHPDVRRLFEVCLERHSPPKALLESAMQCSTSNKSKAKNGGSCIASLAEIKLECMVFPSERTAHECRKFMQRRMVQEVEVDGKNHLLNAPICVASIQLQHNLEATSLPKDTANSFEIFVVFFPLAVASVAKQFWQHTGEGISSRYASYCLHSMDLSRETFSSKVKRGSNGSLNRESPVGKGPGHMRPANGNPRYNKEEVKRRKDEGAEEGGSNQVRAADEEDEEEEEEDLSTYLEERFGRNLDFSLSKVAKIAVRRRIAGCLDEVAINEVNSVDLKKVVEESEKEEVSNKTRKLLTGEDVYLFPCGMSAIYNSFRVARHLTGESQDAKTVQFGFPYTDTLKIQEKFNPGGALFLSGGDSNAIKKLQSLLQDKNESKIIAVFCEIPSNPLLRTPDLELLSDLAKKHDFLLIVDDTIGNFINVNSIDYADMVVSSLTKIFSGDSNVMAGSLVVSPKSRKWEEIRTALDKTLYEDNLWLEDAIFLERNSRTFKTRSKIVNKNTDAVCEYLKEQPIIQDLFYPKYTDREIYDRHAVKSESGSDIGYGGLFSVVFEKREAAIAFFDYLNVSKGPSLGTNFTLASPYTILAHYAELEWAAGHGVPTNLVRVSIGVEPQDELLEIFKFAVEKAVAADAKA